MSKTELIFCLLFVIWTFGCALLGYKYGYSDGMDRANKTWHKNIKIAMTRMRRKGEMK